MIKSRADVLSVGAVSAEKETFNRAGCVDHVTQDHEKGDEIASTNPPMAQGSNRAMTSTGIKPANECGG